MLRPALGQTPQFGPCSPGYYPPPAQCPNYDSYKISIDPSGSGCQRCDPKGPVESSGTNCMRALQFYLPGQGQISLAAVTGDLNPETQNALLRRLGPSWAQYPGGACAILASIQTGILPSTAPGYMPYYPPVTTSPTTILLVLGGIVLLVLALGKR